MIEQETANRTWQIYSVVISFVTRNKQALMNSSVFLWGTVEIRACGWERVLGLLLPAVFSLVWSLVIFKGPVHSKIKNAYCVYYRICHVLYKLLSFWDVCPLSNYIALGLWLIKSWPFLLKIIYRPCCWQFHVGERIHSSSTHHGWEADFRVNCPFNRHHFWLILADFFSVNFSSRPSTTVLVKPKATQSQNSHIITLASWHGKLYKEWTHPADTEQHEHWFNVALPSNRLTQILLLKALQLLNASLCEPGSHWTCQHNVVFWALLLKTAAFLV